MDLAAAAAAPISSPLGKGGEPAATVVGPHSREGLWASVNSDHLVKLIMDQIPRYDFFFLLSQLSLFHHII